jgi:hypothetical protein
LDKFFQQHTAPFFSSNAVTSPEEDIAGSFMYFIFKPRPSRDGISEQKVLFFYDYLEMKTLRKYIFENFCAYVEKP